MTTTAQKSCLRTGQVSNRRRHPVVALTTEEFTVTSEETFTQVNPHVLGAGDLAYIDAFGGGLVPVKIVAVTRDGIKVKVTAKRKGWAYGEVLSFGTHTLAVVARDSVTVRRGQYRITGGTRFRTTDGEVL